MNGKRRKPYVKGKGRERERESDKSKEKELSSIERKRTE